MEKRKGMKQPVGQLSQKAPKEHLVDRNNGSNQKEACAAGCSASLSTQEGLTKGRCSVSRDAPSKSKKNIALINPNAKHNKGKGAEREKEMLKQVLSEEHIHITTSDQIVEGIWSTYMGNPIDLAILSGGDGTVHKFINTNFIENYRRFGQGMTLTEFGHRLNRLALDRGSGICLPVIYHNPRGTVNFLAELLKTKGGKEKIIRTHLKAKENAEDITKVLDVVYIPVLIMYPKEHPHSTGNIQLMTVYGDGFAFNSINEYEKLKEKWKGLEMGAALQVYIKGYISGIIGLIVDKIAKLISGSTEKGREIYQKRFSDVLVAPIEGEVKVDGKVLPFDARAMTLIGTHWMNAQGVKPFWRMPKHATSMRTHFPAGTMVDAGVLDPKSYTFHLFSGNPSVKNILMGAYRFLLGRPANIKGLLDMEGKRIEIEKKKDFSIIADGTRYHKLPSGETLVIEIAYLQPFVCNP